MNSQTHPKKNHKKSKNIEEDFTRDKKTEYKAKKTIKLLPAFIMDQKVKIVSGFYKWKIWSIRWFTPGTKKEEEDEILTKSSYLIITTLYDSINVEEQDIELL